MNLPNKLTVLRMLLIPIFVAVLAFDPDWGTWDVLGAELPVSHFVAAMIFSVAAITDWFDGHLARKHKLITNFGKFMDPLADKMLVTAALVYLVELDFVAAWIVVIIICREFAVTGLRLVASDEGIVLAAGNSGKAKTWVQLTSIIAYLLHDVGFALVGIPFADITMWLALILTIYSGVEYFAKNIKLITKSM
ncbi:CDP-diacylglycerol--glycerol-3-phosphate 3-phosphatidyltransferase [Exiguobacterium flavidum]|uniref:CDP-diacylglycerol--glycerol-3-phosphate 3-phosphatidyltransferase n=1 Tax=Exiguobacterium flavidum TaxID=2184695 RepID=UPI000DF84784|nr:CDP-diacylglycerol--glycerol-3-phosphate 3-phosphatidyltransferase [Exiguobacterium flavidum]